MSTIQSIRSLVLLIHYQGLICFDWHGEKPHQKWSFITVRGVALLQEGFRNIWDTTEWSSFILGGSSSCCIELDLPKWDGVEGPSTLFPRFSRRLWGLRSYLLRATDAERIPETKIWDTVSHNHCNEDLIEKLGRDWFWKSSSCLILLFHIWKMLQASNCFIISICLWLFVLLFKVSLTSWHRFPKCLSCPQSIIVEMKLILLRKLSEFPV